MGFLKSIIAKVSMDASEFEAGAKKVENVSEHMGEEVAHHFKAALAGAFGAAALEEGVRSIVEYAAHVKDMAEQTGLSTDEVQRLGFAAQATGLQFEDFQTALSKLGGARKEAAENNDALLNQFGRFGITLQDLQNPILRNIDLVYKMAQAIQHMVLSASDRDSLREFFGKSGDKLAESIGQIEKVKDRPIISEQDIEAIDRMEKSVSRLITTMKASAAGPVAAAAEGIADTADNAGKTSRHVAKGIDLFASLFGLGSDEASSQPYGQRFKRVAHGIFSALGFGDDVSSPLTGEMPHPRDISKGSETAPGFDGESKAAQSAPMFTDARKEALAKQENELRELLQKYSFNTLTADEKKIVLQKQYNQLLSDAVNMEQEMGDKQAANELRIKAAQKHLEIQALGTAVQPAKPPSDWIQRIGGSIGGAENVMAQLAREGNLMLKKIESNTRPPQQRTLTTKH